MESACLPPAVGDPCPVVAVISPPPSSAPQALLPGGDQRPGQHRSQHPGRAPRGRAAHEPAGAVCAAGAGGKACQREGQREGACPEGREGVAQHVALQARAESPYFSHLG